MATPRKLLRAAPAAAAAAETLSEAAKLAAGAARAAGRVEEALSLCCLGRSAHVIAKVLRIGDASQLQAHATDAGPADVASLSSAVSRRRQRGRRARRLEAQDGCSAEPKSASWSDAVTSVGSAGSSPWMERSVSPPAKKDPLLFNLFDDETLSEENEFERSTPASCRQALVDADYGEKPTTLSTSGHEPGEKPGSPPRASPRVADLVPLHARAVHEGREDPEEDQVAAAPPDMIVVRRVLRSLVIADLPREHLDSAFAALSRDPKLCQCLDFVCSVGLEAASTAEARLAVEET